MLDFRLHTSVHQAGTFNPNETIIKVPNPKPAQWFGGYLRHIISSLTNHDVCASIGTGTNHTAKRRYTNNAKQELYFPSS